MMMHPFRGIQFAASKIVEVGFRGASSPSTAEQTRSLAQVKEWAAAYGQQQDAIMDETDEGILDQLGSEVDRFLSRIETQWMGSRYAHLTHSNQDMLRNATRTLRGLMFRINLRLEDAKQDRALIKKMQHVAAPESLEGNPTQRNFLKWVKNRFHYSPGFLTSVARLPAPNKPT